MAGTIGLVLLLAVLTIAKPAGVWQLLRTTDLRLLTGAAAVAMASLMMRGCRLALLLEPGRLPFPRATLVATAAQAAALFAPARTGELALPWLLSRHGGAGLASGVGTLLAARALDFATLGVWAGSAVLGMRGLNRPFLLVAALFLITAPLLLAPALTATDRLTTRLLAPRGQRGRRWTRRIRRIRRELAAQRRRPLRLVLATLASLAMWGLQWALAWILLVAMGHSWPPAKVVAGATAASLANLLPVNAIGNLGPLEASWTAAFTALGVPLREAAATGLATHIWGLLFAGGFGACAWGILSGIAAAARVEARQKSDSPFDSQ
ncbi:MAG: lysylphosphatidylglycerol synthase transmembrane domain-containing protein [Thermoanaerobaculales bacterium]